ncbi:MAG: patatin-like phospholipase family protein, partial [Phocaeicola sp.]
LLKGVNLDNLFKELTIGYHDSLDFNKFPIPFACVAYNMVDGSEVDFHSGVLATAMRASMAIPAAFTPVRLGDQVLVDGGAINNYPVNVALAMGADYVIGVDVRSKLRQADNLVKTPEILMQMIDLMGLELYHKNVKNTDVYMKVDVSGYTAASFTTLAIDSLISRGYQAASLQREALEELKKELGIEAEYQINHNSQYSANSNRKVYIGKIILNGMDSKDKKRILKRCQLAENAETTVKTIEESIAILTSYLGYSGVKYQLKRNDQTSESYDLVFSAQRRYENKVSLGVRFDSEETASVEVNGIYNFKTSIPTSLSLTGRFGERYKGRLTYSFDPSPLKNLSLSYQFRYNSIDYYQNGTKMQNTTFRCHTGEFAYTSTWRKNLRFDLGIRAESYNYDRFLYIDNENRRYDTEDEHFFSYFAKIHYSTFDTPYFPRVGLSTKASIESYTDNFVGYKKKTPILACYGSFESVIPITERFSVLPGAYSRLVFYDGDTPFSKLSTIGGDVADRFVLDQIPFYGVNGCQLMDDFLLVWALKLRQRLGAIHYIQLVSNYALNSNKITNLFKEYNILGFGVGYGMDSIFGPLEASVNYTNRGQKVGVYVNLGYKF